MYVLAVNDVADIRKKDNAMAIFPTLYWFIRTNVLKPLMLDKLYALCGKFY
jgi:hypothetical protein